MLRYFKKKDGLESHPSTNVIETSNSKNTQSKDQGGDSNVRDKEENSSKYRKINLDTLPADPGERKKIDDFHPSARDEIRRAYLQKGPCQPRNHAFQERIIGGRSRRFNAIWFDSYKYWLEYSITEESAFCLCCYLFKPEIKNQGGYDSFVSGGFKAWNKKNRLDEHNFGNAHNLAVQKCQNLMKQAQSIASVLDRQTNIVRKEYRIRLEASIDCVRFCLRQGLPFRGHDEHEDSSNRWNFLELLSFYAGKVEEVGNVVLQNDPRNSQMTSPKIQKDIVHVIATETRKAIIKDLGDDLFGILVDESRDVSCKEHMVLVLRYVNNEGCVMERFIGIAHVNDTLAASLKDEIVSMLSEYGLSPSRIRGQGYDGASNMRCEFNGLKTLIMRDTPSAYYIHCFAHQLQLALVFVAKNHFDIDDFFDWVSRILNMIGASCKRRDKLREKQAQKVAESFVILDEDLTMVHF